MLVFWFGTVFFGMDVMVKNGRGSFAGAPPRIVGCLIVSFRLFLDYGYCPYGYVVGIYHPYYIGALASVYVDAYAFVIVY